MYALEPEPEHNKRWTVFGMAALITTLLQGSVLIWASGIEPEPVERMRTHISMRVTRKTVASKKKERSVIERVEPKTEDIKRVAATSKKSPKRSVQSPKPMPFSRKPSNPKPNPPLVVGLTMSSTVQGGQGPRLGIGNTLMGAVERTARSPQKISPINNTQNLNLNNLSSLSKSENSKKRTEAKLLKKSIPDYPIRARNKGIEGVIVLALTISPKGIVEAVRVIKGIGYGLDKSALVAARKTIWKPATIGGRPVRSMRRYNVRFTLES